jgi:hypothetical protein
MNEAGANEELFSIIIVSQLFNTNNPVNQSAKAIMLSNKFINNSMLELPEIGLIC